MKMIPIFAAAGLLACGTAWAETNTTGGVTVLAPDVMEQVEAVAQAVEETELKERTIDEMPEIRQIDARTAELQAEIERLETADRKTRVTSAVRHRLLYLREALRLTEAARRDAVERIKAQLGD